MGFSAKQLQALRRDLDFRHVRTREAHGRELSYLEGWYVLSEANRIFGFDGWSRETLETRCVLTRESRGSFLAVYLARVRITVNAHGSTIVREGHGSGEGRGISPGETHDIAVKAAETDATKRALATFGKPFGLELYRHGKGHKQHHRDGDNAQGHMTKPAQEKDGNRDHGSESKVAQDRDSKATPVNYASLTTYSVAAADNSAPSAHPAGNAEAATPSPTVRPPGAADAGISTSANALGTAEGRTGFHPDDTTPIPRPSRYYGRRRSPPVSEHLARERRRLTQSTAAPPLVPAPAQAGEDRIDKSTLAIPEPKRIRDRAHLQFVASQPCLICGRQPCDPHHLRFAQPRAIGMKVSDEFTVPLCRGHHRQLHQAGNEVSWWQRHNIDALKVARELWEQSYPKLATSATKTVVADNKKDFGQGE